MLRIPSWKTEPECFFQPPDNDIDSRDFHQVDLHTGIDAGARLRSLVSILEAGLASAAGKQNLYLINTPI